jgi:single-strand DNA-binding protein
VSIWRQRAERAAEFLQKGRLVLISGRVQIREYTDRDNNKRTAVDVVADDFQMLDSRPTGEGSAPRAVAANSGGNSDLPEYEYNPADEEVPF